MRDSSWYLICSYRDNQKNYQKNTEGTETQNHRNNNVNNEPNGIAPEDPYAHSITFKIKIIVKTTPG